MGKYEDWLSEKKIPAEISIVELGVFAKMLGIDVASIRIRRFGALFEELLEEVKRLGISVERNP